MEPTPWLDLFVHWKKGIDHHLQQDWEMLAVLGRKLEEQEKKLEQLERRLDTHQASEGEHHDVS